MQSKLRIFATAFLVFSLSLFVFLFISPREVDANNGQEVCPNTGGGWVKVDGLNSLTHMYNAPADKLISKVCYKASTEVVYKTVNPPQASYLVSSEVFNSPGQGVICTAPGEPENGCSLQNLSHASFLLVDKPVVPDPYFNIAVCYADNHYARFGYLARDFDLPTSHSEWMTPNSYNLPTLPFGLNSTRVWSDEVYPTNLGNIVLSVKINGSTKTATIGSKSELLGLCPELTYIRCSETIETPGEWSAWVIDSEDNSRFVSERIISYFDSQEKEYLCDSTTEKKYLDRDICEWDEELYADDPLCVEPNGNGDTEEEDDDEGDVLGVDDEAEVKGTTTVVLAPTAAGDRSTIFLIQSLLLIATGFSLIYVGKEYLNRV